MFGCLTLVPPFSSEVQSFPIHSSFERIVGRNVLVVFVAVASLMDYAPNEFGHRYAEFVGPLFNESFKLRFEIEINSD